MKTCPPPDLQELIELAGGQLMEEHWQEFDRATAEYQRARREVGFDDATDPALAILANAGPPERAWPYQPCIVCGGAARFGYRNGDQWDWGCAQHRLAQWWADARR
jgi:hypothetical protein